MLTQNRAINTYKETARLGNCSNKGHYGENEKHESVVQEA